MPHVYCPCPRSPGLPKRIHSMGHMSIEKCFVGPSTPFVLMPCQSPSPRMQLPSNLCIASLESLSSLGYVPSRRGCCSLMVYHAIGVLKTNLTLLLFALHFLPLHLCWPPSPWHVPPWGLAPFSPTHLKGLPCQTPLLHAMQPSCITLFSPAQCSPPGGSGPWEWHLFPG